jgi:hypothetical protein
MPRLQAIFDKPGYHALDVAELLLIRDLELRATA